MADLNLTFTGSEDDKSPFRNSRGAVHIPKQNLLVKCRLWAWKGGNKIFDHSNLTWPTQNCIFSLKEWRLCYISWRKDVFSFLFFPSFSLLYLCSNSFHHIILYLKGKKKKRQNKTATFFSPLVHKSIRSLSLINFTDKMPLLFLEGKEQNYCFPPCWLHMHEI